MRVISGKLAIAMLCGLSATTSSAKQQVAAAQAFTLADMLSQADLSTPALSPDGHWAALVVTRSNLDTNRYDKSLILIDLETGSVRTLAVGNLGSPAWSSRGTSLAWMNVDEAGRGQVVVLSQATSADAPKALTNVTVGDGVRSFVWSPDGASIAYIAAGARKEPLNQAFFAEESSYLSTSAQSRTPGPLPAMLWLAPLNGIARPITPQPTYIRQLSWRPDGGAIYLVVQSGPGTVASRNDMIQSINVESGKAQLVAGPVNMGTAGNLVVSPSGAVAYPRYKGRDPWTYPNAAALVVEGKPRNLTTQLDRNIQALAWLPVGDALLVKANDKGRTGLWTVSMNGVSSRLDLGSVEPVSDMSVTPQGKLAFIGSEPARPPELYVMDSLRAKPVRFTAINAVVEVRRPARTVIVTWQSDGYSHDGVLSYPAGYMPTKRYPMIVRLHGGPEASSTLAFDREAQFFAGRGWLVFQPNYRGSDDQGERYQTAVIGDPTDGPGRDILAGIAAVKTMASVDDQAIAIDGWSYGGVMTSWLIGHHDWCAAAPGALVVDFVKYYDESEFGYWIETLLGSPYKGNNLSTYTRASPSTYLDRIRTPTFIWQNVGDPNAVIGQAYALYHALKDRGVKVRFLVRNSDEHGYGSPLQTRDLFRDEAAWMDENCRPMMKAAPVQGN